MTDERIAELGHRYAWRYKHSSDPHHSHTYTFNAHCLRDLARAIERELNGGDQWSRVVGAKPNGEHEYAQPPVECICTTDAQMLPCTRFCTRVAEAMRKHSTAGVQEVDRG